MRVYAPHASPWQELSALLHAGQLVAIPTETVYGLAAHALDPDACAQVFGVKGRPAHDPLIVHVARVEQAQALAHWNDRAERLAAAFWPGPLTLVLRRRDVVPNIVTAGLETVALRMPAHPAARALLQACNLPLAAPSANPFGYLSPTRPEHVAANLGDRIPALLDGGPCTHGVESTIVDLSGDRPAILRPGVITADELTQALGAPVAPFVPASAEPTAPAAPRAPGLLDRHYSPHTPLYLFPTDGLPAAPLPGSAVLFLRDDDRRSQIPTGIDVFALSPDGNLATVAHALYDQLRTRDAEARPALYAERAPEAGLGAAINDRLTRAARR